MNLSATRLAELDIRALENPISIKFADVKASCVGVVVKCVWFYLHGLVKFSKYLTSGNICSTYEEGHFFIVVKSLGNHCIA